MITRQIKLSEKMIPRVLLFVNEKEANIIPEVVKTTTNKPKPKTNNKPKTQDKSHQLIWLKTTGALTGDGFEMNEKEALVYWGSSRI